MKKFFQTSNAFFLVAVLSFITSVLILIKGALTGRFGAYLALTVVFFILGLAVIKKNAQQTIETTTKS